MKMRSTLFFLMLLILAAVPSYAALSGSNAPRYGGVLKVAITSDPASLDPALEGSVNEQIPAAHIFETALAMDPSGNIYPSVCTFETKDGGMVIELSLRSGVKFHDGSTVTMEDIEASAKRWLGNVGFAKTHLGSALKNMVVRGGKLMFTFNKPAPLALTAIASWDRGLYIFPKTVCEKYPDVKIENADLIGTGPYKFKEHQADRFVVLEKFKDYVPYESGGSGLAAAKRGYVDTMFFYPVPDRISIMNGVRTGEYDVGFGVPANLLSEMRENPELRVEIKDVGIMPVMVFNSKQGPCTDVNLRNAILACLDMDELMMAAQGDKSLYYLNPSVMSKSSRWWLDESLGKYNKVDLGRAKEYLEASSYDGRPLVFITTKANDFFYKTALVVQQMVKQVGIVIDLQVYDNPTLQQFRNQPDKFDIFSSGLTAKVDPTLVSFMDDEWAGFYKSERKSKYLDIMNGESDFETRRRAWAELTKVLYEELPVITFGERSVGVVVRGKVQNLFETTQYYWNTWIQQ